MTKTSIYCQNCRQANNLNDSHCQNCGTRLLLVIFPNSLQYDTNHVPSFYEDHLLERVTLLELRLVQLTESLQVAMEIIREQGKMVKEENSMVKSLYHALGLLKSEETEKIRKAFDELQQKENSNRAERDRSDRLIENILDRHDAPNAELLTHLLSEGLRLLEEKEEKQAFRMLERAVLLSPKNVPLLWFLSENYLRADKFAEASRHLENAAHIETNNPKFTLLLGAIAGDAGDLQKARAFLSAVEENDQNTFLLNYVNGVLSAFEENWSQSVQSFQKAALDRDTAEIQYLIGCAFFQMKEEAAALHHLQNAVLLDEKYSDAWFMQAVTMHRRKNKAEEKSLLAAALLNTEAGAQCQEFLRKKNLELETALPFQHFKQEKVRLLTGGALRLNRLLKREIYQAIK